MRSGILIEELASGRVARVQSLVLGTGIELTYHTDSRPKLQGTPAGGDHNIGDHADVAFSGVAIGDLIFRNASSKWANLAVGLSSQVLKGGTTPGWGSVAWTEITGKPSTYPPDPHTHGASDITSGTFEAERVGVSAAGGIPYSPDGSALSDLGAPGSNNVLLSTGPGWGKLTSAYTTGTFPPSSHSLDSHTGSLSLSKLGGASPSTVIRSNTAGTGWETVSGSLGQFLRMIADGTNDIASWVTFSASMVPAGDFASGTYRFPSSLIVGTDPGGSEALRVGGSARVEASSAVLTVESTGVDATAQLKLQGGPAGTYEGIPRITMLGRSELCAFESDDSEHTYYMFYSQLTNARTYSAAIRVFGSAVSSWGTYVELRHDGTDGKISTDTGDLILDPAGQVIVGSDPGGSEAFRVTGAGRFSSSLRWGGGVAIASSDNLVQNPMTAELEIRRAGNAIGLELREHTEIGGTYPDGAYYDSPELRFTASYDSQAGVGGTRAEVYADIWLDYTGSEASKDSRLAFEVDGSVVMYLHDDPMVELPDGVDLKLGGLTWSPKHDKGDSGNSTVTVNFWDGNEQYVNLTNTSSIAINITGEQPGAIVVLTIRRGSGSGAVTWDSQIDWGDKGAPTIPTTAGQAIEVTLHCHSTSETTGSWNQRTYTLADI